MASEVAGRKALVSPRLPPLAYDTIDPCLQGQRLPAAWFAEPVLPGPEPSINEAYREEAEMPVESVGSSRKKLFALQNI